MARVLVTGAATWTGGRLIQRLETRGDVEVLAVDALPPRLGFRSSFIRASLDDLDLAHRILDWGPTVVVHLQTIDRSAELGRRRAREGLILGSQALFGAVERSGTVRSVIVKSDAAVYGAGPRHPSVMTERTRARGASTAYERAIREVETFVDGLRDHLADVTFTVLRFTSIFGPSVENPLSRYLRLAAVPTQFGFDPRLQLIYEEDAVRALLHAVERPVGGTFNVAAPGVLYLGRILRLGGRRAQPLPGRAFREVTRALRLAGLALPDHVVNVLRYGRVLDLGAMTGVFGFRPALTTRQAVLAGYERLPADVLPPEVRAG